MANSNSPKSRGGGAPPKKLSPEKSASFHGRIPTDHRPLRRPKTQPDLLAGRRGAAIGGGWTSSPESSPGSAAADVSRVPTKVLVNVTVQRILGPVQVMASTVWTVGDLVAAAIRQYAKEGRRPLLPSPAEPSTFDLHYSQFSLERLDTEEKLIGLGSRNFFLCPKQPPMITTPALSSPPPVGAHAAAAAASSCSNQAGEKASKIVLPWLRFMDFLL